ncbi:MAG: hypothetical protein L6R38_009404 [Xanthoria sp. 2 TBL-2021]|nr:MAG: hypothetical protein L6R38_009404 [Xanthoria sp. 2 TBL-2021]
MDQLICVVDATTLVENIQQIKRLVHQGQIRLVVPQCTATALERKYANFKEEANKKPPRQVEPQRPRASGKPAKIEHPAFDINPLVAGEFLAKLQSNDKSTVEFQKDSEQYSPWKLMELEEENRSATENRPATFAQAVQKQNIERLLNSDGAGNGPMKPRLVARTTGSDGSPWKKSNKALSLPISEVPKDARPILSCLLWRLYEKGATRWDTDRTTLLCDNEEITSLAKRLGIPARSTTEVRLLCDKRRTVDTRETSGNLEDHFGIQEKARTIASDNHVAKPEEAAISLPRFQPLEDKTQEKHAPDQDKIKTPSSHSTQSSASTATAQSSETEKKSADAEKSEDQRASNITNDSKLSEGKLEVALETILSCGEKRNVPGLLVTNIDKGKTVAALAENSQASAQPAHSSSNTLDPEKEHSIAAWVRSLMSNGELSGRNSPLSGSSAVEPVAPEIEPVQDFKPLTYRQAVTGKADEAVKQQAPPPAPKEMLPSPRVSPVRNPSPPKGEIEDSVDSDEEIVVFNPKAKRLSAQKAQQTQQVQQTQKAQQAQQTQQAPQNQQVQQPQQDQQPQQPQQNQQTQQTQQLQQSQPNLRPQTPTSSPRVSHARNVSGGRPQSRGTNQRQSRPGPPPVVIDPDSFGRDLLTNPQPNVPRTFSPYGAHGRITNHHRGNYRAHNPRSHVQNTPPRMNGVALVNGSGNVNVQRAAEQQPSPSEPSRTEVVETMQTSPAAVTTTPTVLEPSPMADDSSTGPPPSAPTGPGISVNGSPNVNVRPDRPRYSPRGSPRHTPASSEPEVPFILRSGQPRDVTRGKGKLWVP